MAAPDQPDAGTRPGVGLIVALGITQIVGWGSLYFSFGFLFQPIQNELQLSADRVAGAFSLALLFSGLVAPRVGARIDRHGGRRLMTAGSLAVVVLLVLLSRVHSVWTLYACYAALGMAMACTLYEPAFVVLTQAFRANPRRAITLVTLLGGLSGTVFWPLTQALVGWLGWRDTLLVLAAMNLAICVPLHARLPAGVRPERPLDPASTPASVVDAPSVMTVLPALQAQTQTQTQTPGAVAAGAGSGLEGAPDLAAIRRDPMFRALRLTFVGHALLFSSILVHLMSVLQYKGLDAAGAALVGALIGPMQIAGRLLELTWGRRLTILTVGQAAICLVPAALMLLWLLPTGVSPWMLALFALPFGLGNGLLTIVRGTAVAELWGHRHYGRISGAIARPVLAANALGPLVAAWLLEASGSYDLVLLMLIGVGSTTAGVFVTAVRKRNRRAAPAGAGR